MSGYAALARTRERREVVDTPVNLSLRPNDYPALSALAGIASGLIGYHLYPERSWLGIFAGALLGFEVPHLLQGDRDAWISVAGTASGIFASKAWPAHPYLGYALGKIGGTVAGTVIAERKRLT